MKKVLFFACSIAVFSCSPKNGPCIDETKIKKDAICAQDYNPVCGCDKKTYSNVCQAESAGVTSWDNGKCKEDKK